MYETHKVFIDNMVFPRFVMPFGNNAVLAKESNADELWKYTDTNSDGTADKKELFATGFGRLANVEHQESGLTWAHGQLDLQHLSTRSASAGRRPACCASRPGRTAASGASRRTTTARCGSRPGASGMPGYFQFPVAYGNFDDIPEQFEPNLNITWGAPVLIADMQGGMNAVRMPDGSLARATGAAGNDVFRGDRLPKDMVGDYFYGEPVARIVRRLRPVKTEGLTQLQNVYPLSEFIRSTDPLFRPVDMTTAPDGTMYITDMYRGIIQESQWSGPGTYLRAAHRAVRARQGREARAHLAPDLRRHGAPHDAPRMLDETPAQLVAHSGRSERLVARHGAAAARAQAGQVGRAGAQQMARTSTNQLARIHALWTLEGLAAADAALIRELMKDARSADPACRRSASSETLVQGRRPLARRRLQDARAGRRPGRDACRR